MKPELKHFFDSMGAYFEGAPEGAGLERLYAAHPGWETPRTRTSLYGGFVRGHVRGALEKLFPLSRQGVGEAAWDALVEEYTRTRPARHYEINRLGEAFPGHVADRVEELGFAPHVPALARFEWADFAVFASEEVVPGAVDRLTANPTLTVLEHAFRICAHVRAGDARAVPEAGEELALLWRHPGQLATFYMEATPSALLVLKMAVEGLTAEHVAAATGMSEAQVRADVVRFARDGLVLLPPESP
ncbi:putative DNA-binding domain-containing protein [Myxococcaceae bacterium JPH2]|nr:putative DNA-binding domain-containing protein [Myxococcaceae bacterium JPH2]